MEIHRIPLESSARVTLFEVLWIAATVTIPMVISLLVAHVFMNS